MRWHLSHRFDPAGVDLADRHYSRQTVGSPQYVRPGKCICLLTERQDALWVSSWQKPEYVKHAWPAWECTLFRNEGHELSSELIREAVAATLALWVEPPVLGFITFVNPAKVRAKTRPGYCFIKAGWEHLATTEDGKLVFRLMPNNFGTSVYPRQRTTRQLPLFDAARSNVTRLRFPLRLVTRDGRVVAQSNNPSVLVSDNKTEGAAKCRSTNATTKTEHFTEHFSGAPHE